MNDLISRQAAIDAFMTSTSDGDKAEWCEWVLRQLPSAERKGKWIIQNVVLTSNPPQYQWRCSECGRMVHWFTTEVLTNYCPNCGADMRGEQDE